MSINVSGSHSRGPILGDNAAMGGLFEDVSLAAVDLARGPYKVWVEQFPHVFADGQLELSGATVTDIGVVAANTETVTTAAGGLLLNPGTAADTGVQVQFNIAASAAATNPKLNVMGPITLGNSTFNNRELFWFTRFGVSQSDTTTWEGKALLGMFVTDTSLLAPTTGEPSVASSGGAGFHIGETGNISFLADDQALTVADLTSAQVVKSIATLGAAGVFQYYDCGFRYRQIDDVNGYGNLDFYFGSVGSMVRVGQRTLTSGFLSGALAVSYAILNGPTGTTNLADMVIESIVTGHTRNSSV